MLLSQWAVGQCVFFSLGNSHLMATVDISGAYTGLSDYNATVVALLTALITFSGQVMALTRAGVEMRMGMEQGADTGMHKVPGGRASAFAVFQFCAATRIFVATAVLAAMRTHLFVWTVWAPKWALELLLFGVSVVGAHVAL